MKTSYKCLENQEYTIQDLSLVPIRWEDRYKIMQWRNEQMFHLRQDKELTVEDQDTYFKNIISTLFYQEKPNQILFSLLKDNRCIGYGGLVHIDWESKTAEISLLLDTELEKIEFNKLWVLYLALIERIAFHQINLNEIFTYSYEVRPKLYPVLDQAGFIEKERISNAIKIQNNLVDALIHIKRKNELTQRPVQHSDAQLLFEWANDSLTRGSSLNSNKITWEEHLRWFNQKMNNPKIKMFLFLEKNPVGILRLDEVNDKLNISFSVDIEQRGRGIGSDIISFALKKFSGSDFSAQVIESNIGSHRIFLKKKFILDHISRSENKKVMHYLKKAPHENN